MDATVPAPTTIDAYIALYPADVQTILQKVRATVHEAAPGAVEAIKYQLPTLILHGNLVHFGAFKNHIGFYPTPSGTEHFEAQLKPYARAKGSIQFPLDQPIPYDLIREITEFRVQENAAKAAAKAEAKKKK